MDSLDAAKSKPNRLAVAAIAVGASLAIAPTANAADFAGGTTTLSVNKAFAKKLKQAKTRLIAGKPAALSGGRLTLPITGGQATFGGTGTLAHGGTLTFRRGSKKLVLKEISEQLKGSTATLSGKAGARRVSLLDQQAGSRVKAAPGMVGLDGTKLPVTLSSAGAKALNKGLRVKTFVRGMKVGSLSFKADRAITFTPGSGNGRQAFDQGTAAKFGECGVSFAPIAPATGEPPSPNAPAGAFTFPLDGGTLNARTGAGEIRFAGGYRLAKGQTVADVTAPYFVMARATTGQLTGAASPLSGLRAPLGDIVSGEFKPQLDANGGTFTFAQVDIRVSQLGETFLSQVYGCTNIKAGDPFATAAGSGNVT